MAVVVILKAKGTSKIMARLWSALVALLVVVTAIPSVNFISIELIRYLCDAAPGPATSGIRRQPLF